jgi:hypothetical protein
MHTMINGHFFRYGFSRRVCNTISAQVVADGTKTKMRALEIFIIFSVLTLSCAAAVFDDDADWIKVREKRSAAPVAEKDGQK